MIFLENGGILMRLAPGPLEKRVGMLILGALLTASGCGGPSKGSISGSVLYKAQNLKGGRVTFINDKKETFPAEIDENGKYEILDVPPGDYKVCVETEFLKPTLAMAMMAKSRPTDAPGPDLTAQAKSYVAIPAKYGTPDRTSLTCTVKAGKQEHDIKLD
jgi:hypothetical protein